MFLIGVIFIGTFVLQLFAHKNSILFSLHLLFSLEIDVFFKKAFGIKPKTDNVK